MIMIMEPASSYQLESACTCARNYPHLAALYINKCYPEDPQSTNQLVLDAVFHCLEDDMLLVSNLLVISLVCATTSSLVVTRAKVKGPGYTLLAKTGKACASLCESQQACDSANFEKVTNKCRIFSRCSPALIVYNSTTHVHFSKRPMITESGYKYHEESDSCLKLVEELTDYAGAEALCRSRSGRLIALTDESINRLAAEMLSGSQAQFAWVGATDSLWEGNPLLSDGRRVSETGWFPVGSQEMRKDPRRNCWSLSDSGTWSEHPCKGRTQFSICQITPFNN